MGGIASSTVAGYRARLLAAGAALKRYGIEAPHAARRMLRAWREREPARARPADARDTGAWIYGDMDNATLSGSARVMRVAGLLCAVMLLWASCAELDEVATGSGRVVPTLREQVIQSLEGGILADLGVREDDMVEAGQILAQLDPTRTESNVEESAARYRAALARQARLSAEVNQSELVFPEALQAHPDLRAAERRLYDVRLHALEQSSRWLREGLELARSELDISVSLSKKGAASSVEVLRLRRQIADLELKLEELLSEYIVAARDELAKVSADVQALSSVIRGRADALERLTLRSPVRGIVKNIEVTTIGGVVPPNGRLMDIVPVDDQLMIEARLSPRDIAFIHPGQRASIKITAYDYAIYGGLEGRVTTISPDTIRDEVNPEQYYYRVFVRTESDALTTSAGKRLPIGPGMIATADIHTGSKTVLAYLLKPYNRAREALRER